MSTELIIEGEMGKGGSKPVEAKDNLISDQIVKTLFVVGEGEIQGVDGIYLDTVGIANFDATYEVRTGVTGQTVIADFINTETTLPGFTSKTLDRGSAKKAGEELPNVSAPTSTNAGSFVINNYYKITTVGTTTNWKAIGASTVAGMYGEVFKATGVGSGNGVAIQQLRFEPNAYYTVVPYSATPAAAKLTFSISVMSTLDGDGNMKGGQVTIAVYSRPNSASNWVLEKSITKKGKTTHGYTFDYTIKQPTAATAAAPWEIRVIRISPDSASAKKQNTITWTTTTQVYYSNLSYDNPPSALIGVKLNDASQFGNKIPEIMFRVKGKKVKIPSNYDATNRIYTGTWDGSWKSTLSVVTKTYTNNPAWCLYDILTDTVAGIGIPEADIDKYSIYNLAKYADEQLANGYSVPVVCQDNGEVLEESYPLFIPRFTLDYSFNTREGVKELLSQVLSLCNANLITNEFGQIAVIFQKPGQTIKRNISNANVVDGTFTYQSSNIEQRSNLVNVTYNNGLNFGRTDTVTVSDESLITRYGLQPLDIVLPGCYYQAQAVRKARWALYTNCFFTNFVSFSVFLDGMTYKIGDLIRVYDNYNQDTQQAGTIVGSSTVSSSTTLTFDRPITLGTGTFTFSCFDSSGAEVTKTVTGGTTISSVTIPSLVTVLTSSIFIFSSTTVSGKVYRVTSISQNSDEQYAITGLEFDDAIFTYVDGTVNLTPKSGDFSGVGQFYTRPIESISVIENFGTNGTYTTGKLQASWTWDTAKTQKYRANYKIAWSVDDGITSIADNLNTDTYDIVNPIPGVYTITVWAINSFTGISSAPFSYQYAFRTVGALSSLQPPVNLRITGSAVVTPQPATLSFATPALSLQFDYNPANQNVEDALYDYLVEIWNSTGTTKISSYSVNPIVGTSTTDPIDPDLTYKPLNGLFELSFNENVNIFNGTPSRTLTVKIYSRDTLGDLSIPISVSCTNPVPAFTSFTVSNDISKVRIDITASADIDVKEYYVWRGSTALFTPSNDTNLLYKGPSNSITVNTPDNNSYYYKCAISDSFGNTNLNISDSKAGASIDMTVSRYSYVGLQFSTVESTNTVSWTSFTAYRETGISEVIALGSAVWTTGTLYLYYVPGNETLQSTTDANTAVAGRILGSYKGGNNITADAGKAYIDGDQIIAGSLLVNALATNTAYITNMAMIGNIIQSDNYSTVATVAATAIVAGRVYTIVSAGTTNFTLIGAANNSVGTVFTATAVGTGTGTVTSSNAGWRIDKSGAANFTGLTVQSATIDTNSNLGSKSVSTVLTDVSTGLTRAKTFYAASAPTANAAGDLWYDTANGTLKRWSGTVWDSTSDATLSRLAGSGVNVMHPRYCTFEEANLPPIGVNTGTGAGTWSLDSTTSAIGSKSLKLTKAVASFNDYCFLSNNGAYTQQLQSNKKWIFSIFMRSSVANYPVSIFLRYAGDTTAAAFTLTTVAANTWARYSYVLDFSTLNVKDFVVILDPQEFAIANLWFDGIMIEEQIGTLTTPSAYAESPNFLTTFIGDLEATKNRVYRQTTAPTGTSYSTGDLWFNTSTNGDFYQWNGTAWAVVATIGANSSNLKAGTGTNLLQNSVVATLQDFTFVKSPAYTFTGFDLVSAGSNGTPTIYNSLHASVAFTGTFASYGIIFRSGFIPVIPGQRLEAQVHLQVLNTLGTSLTVNFYNSAGNAVVSLDSTVTGGLSEITTNTLITNNITDFTKLWGFVTVPANATQARIEIPCRVNPATSPTELYLSMFYLGYAVAGQTEATPWNQGSSSNTKNLTDGALLGQTAVWTSVTSRPTSLATLNATDGTTLSTASTNASSALTTASTASTNASSALTAVDNIASDSKLTPVEKSSVRAEWNCIEAEKPVFVTQATTYVVSSTAYTTAFTTLGNYLNGSKATAWTAGTPDWITDTNLSTTTDIDGAVFRATFKAYYDARVALSNLINGAIKTIADSAASTASTANTNANSAVTAANGKNKTYTAAAAPTTGVVAGDLWYDTTIGIMKRYNGSTWVSTVYNSKNTSGAGDPSGTANVGDTYFNTTTKLMYTYGSSTDIAATTIATGSTYTIKTVGTTNFVTVGATSNTVGEIFKATGTPTGTGTVSGFTWQKVMPLMTSSNISNFIDSASIGSAQIGTAQVGTLKIAGNAVTVNELILTSEVTLLKPANAANATVDNYLLNGQAITGVDVATRRIINLTVQLAHYSTTDSFFGISRVGQFPIYFTPPSNMIGAAGNVNQYNAIITMDLEAENAIVAAGSFIPGNVYIIQSVGSTNFSNCGAAYPVVTNLFGVLSSYNAVINAVGQTFIAISSGSGSGTAKAVANLGCINLTLVNGAANTSYWNATAPKARLRGVIMTGKR
jgi:predicted phage tail protein